MDCEISSFESNGKVDFYSVNDGECTSYVTELINKLTHSHIHEYTSTCLNHYLVFNDTSKFRTQNQTKPNQTK